MRKKTIIIALSIVFMLAATLQADIIYLKSGDKIEGKISSETTDQIGVQTNNKFFYVMRADIEKIEIIKEKETDYGMIITGGLVIGLLLLAMFFLVGSARQ